MPELCAIRRVGAAKMHRLQTRWISVIGFPSQRHDDDVSSIRRALPTCRLELPIAILANAIHPQIILRLHFTPAIGAIKVMHTPHWMMELERATYAQVSQRCLPVTSARPPSSMLLP